MRLHNVLDELATTPIKDYTLIGIMNDLYDQTIQFDFGDLTNVPCEEWENLYDYAIDLVKLNKFELPFRTVCYTYKAGNWSILIMAFIYEGLLYSTVFYKHIDGGIVVLAGSSAIPSFFTQPRMFE
jgi:hypothetical protein